MKSGRKIILKLLIISIVIAGGIFLVDFLNSTDINEIKPIEEAGKTDSIINYFTDISESEDRKEKTDPQPEKTTKSILTRNDNIKHSAWIPYWGFNDGYKSLKESPEKFSVIMPVLYEVNNDGTLKEYKPKKLPELISFCEARNMTVLPSIPLFNWKTLHEILISEEKTETHITEIVDEVVENDYNGIDIDYESIELDDKRAFMSFLNQLSTEMHNKDKILSVTILPQWAEGEPYPYSPETRKVQDMNQISKYADQIRIMTYDFTSSGSTDSGPIAPILWMDKVLEYAVVDQKVDPDKLWVGVHLYGYRWESVTNPDNPYDITSSKAKAMTYDQMAGIVEKYKIKDSIYDDFLGEGYIEYQAKENEWHVIYFQTPEGVKDREELAKKYGIAGLAYWRLGREGELL